MSQKLRQAADGPLPLVTPTSTQDGIQGKSQASTPSRFDILVRSLHPAVSDPYSQLPPLIRVRGLAPLELLASEDDLQFSASEFKFPPHPCKQLCNLGLRLLSWIPSRFADDRSKFIETETEYPIWLNILRAALKYAYTITPALGGSPYLQPITHRVNMCMILASFIPVSCVNRTSGNALQDLIVSTINYYRLLQHCHVCRN